MITTTSTIVAGVMQTEGSHSPVLGEARNNIQAAQSTLAQPQTDVVATQASVAGVQAAALQTEASLAAALAQVQTSSSTALAQVQTSSSTALAQTQSTLVQTQSTLVQTQASLAASITAQTTLLQQVAQILNCSKAGLFVDASGNCVAAGLSGSCSSAITTCAAGYSPVGATTQACSSASSTTFQCTGSCVADPAFPEIAVVAKRAARSLLGSH